ncbi:amidohydrolase family protein [Microbacterium sp. MYb62]|uniref:amidohydrolase family protein n=1 Tax=Microbacterium sp. MYb62 TaxID=1848690 RepID=UPI0015E44A42|nr:amidohydrolase family protein [Microbacterium sp. MYb62]
MGQTLIRDAIVVTTDAAGTILRGHDVLVRDGLIATIEPHRAERPVVDGVEVIDASGAILMPGLIDTHVHMWEHPWRRACIRPTAPGYFSHLDGFRDLYTPQDTHDGILGSALEMLDHGVTGAVDFFHGANATAAHVDAGLAAHLASGQRVLMGYGANASYDRDHGDLDRARAQRLRDLPRLRDVASASGGRVSIALAMPTPNAGMLPRVIEEVAVARDLGMRMMVHQNGANEVRRLHESDLLGDDLLLVHSNPISDEELEIVADKGVVISTTPQAELTEIVSLSIVRRAVRRGVRLGVGTDTPPIVAPMEMFTALRLTHLMSMLEDHRVLRDERRLPRDHVRDAETLDIDGALRLGTVGGAHAFGLGDRLGEIAVGALADLVIVLPRDPAALDDPAAHLMTSPLVPAEVRDVIVDGRVVKRDGVLQVAEAVGRRERDAAVRARVLGFAEEARRLGRS